MRKYDNGYGVELSTADIVSELIHEARKLAQTDDGYSLMACKAVLECAAKFINDDWNGVPADICLPETVREKIFIAPMRWGKDDE